MFTSSRPLIIATGLLLLAALLAPVPALAKGRGGGGGGAAGGCFDTYFDSLEKGTLTATEQTETLYLREEEKLARDVYLTLGAKWKLRIFSNIAASEQKHMNGVKRVIDLYGLVDSITDDTVGEFNNSELSDLYGNLVTKGNLSLVDALQVGMTIEDLDIRDINHMLDTAANDHLKFVAYNLVKGSRNHMRSFWKVLTGNFEGPDAEAYEAQFLTQDAIDAIVDSPKERGIVYDANGDVIEGCAGGGKGNGQGKGKAGKGKAGKGNGQGKGKRRGMGCGNGQGRGQCDGSNAKSECDGTGPKNKCDGSNAKGECDGTGPKNKCDGTRGGGRRKGQCDGTCNGAGPAGDAEDSGKKGPRGRNR